MLNFRVLYSFGSSGASPPLSCHLVCLCLLTFVIFVSFSRVTWWKHTSVPTGCSPRDSGRLLQGAGSNLYPFVLRENAGCTACSRLALAAGQGALRVNHRSRLD